MLTILTNCGAAEAYIAKCLRSMQAQTVTAWRAFVTVDPCGDATYERAVEIAASDSRIDVVRNATRLYAMENVVRAIARSGSDPEDILIVLDGDDWFATNRALERIAREYAEHGCWLTYGSWISNARRNHGRWPAYPEGTTDFRRAEWRGTAVRTFRRWLWERIDDRDLRDDDDAYFRVVEDQAYMLPMLEMATTARARHIADVLMVYNRANPQCVGEVMLEEMRRAVAVIRARPPYASQSEGTFRLANTGRRIQEAVWRT